ncbi:MAG: hypothetical protein Q9218_006204 [Villophora microphyllina]
MDRVTVANLQAERGCLDVQLLEVDTFEAPSGSTTSLNPPSKTSSVYPFGADGTLAWTTPAGELLQVASCIKNRLMSVEYKRSIDRGRGYLDRGKMLERALNQPHGSGFDIGLSLAIDLEPFERCWLYNRWPRYHFRHDELEIRLQYCIDRHFVVQEYHVRNTGQEEKTLPFTYSSDLVFREHRGAESPIYPVPTNKTRERLFLFCNSELLIQNETENYQVVMAMFQNGQRQSLWSGNRHERNDDGDASSVKSTDSGAEYDETEVRDVEERLRETILAGKLADDVADAEFKSFYRKYNESNDGLKKAGPQEHRDYSSSGAKLVVPAQSTQELRVVIQISSLPHSEAESSMPTSKNGHISLDQKSTGKEPRLNIKGIRAKQRSVLATSKLFSAMPPTLKKWPTYKLIDDHLELGKACAQAKLLGEARYHMLTACLIAEHKYGDDSVKTRHTQFRYAKFLNRYGWYSVALKRMKQLSYDLSMGKSNYREISVLKQKVRVQLASMHLEQGNFSEAEEMYIKAVSEQAGHGTTPDLTPSAAHCLERAAWAQFHQEKYAAAQTNYLLLLDLLGLPQCRVILSNLGLIESRLGNMGKARMHYEAALSPTPGMPGIDILHARSGLFACLQETGAMAEENLEVAASLVRYDDAIAPWFRQTQPKLPIRDGPFCFAMARQLETLLTTCSIRVTDDRGIVGFALVDADPLGCLVEGRAAYFQFRFLTQCHKHIDQMQGDEHSRKMATARIKSACQNHLRWVFQIARFSGTWDTFYRVSGDPIDTPTSSDVPPTSRAVEGAMHFSKLWLHLCTWPDECSFVLDLLHARLSEWLSYLQSTQHVGNLWVERQADETLKPHDTISSSESGTAYRWCPRYELSDFMSLWLALKEIETLIDSIERNPEFCEMDPDHPARQKFADLQRSFDDYGKSFSAHRLRSNILTSFIVSKQGEITSRYTTTENIAHSPDELMLGGSQLNARVDPSDSARSLDRVGLQLETVREHRARESSSRIVASQRTIHDYNWEIQSTDIATIEAAAVGFFEDSNKGIGTVWRETLAMHKDLYVANFEEPRRIALALFAAEVSHPLTASSHHEIGELSRNRLLVSLYDSGAFAQKLVDDAPEPMRSWSGITYETPSHDGRQPDVRPQQSQVKRQLLSGPSLRRRKSIVMPQQVGNSAKSGREIIVDSVYLPDWMYHYPEYIHKGPLDIKVESDLKQLDSVQGLATAVATWRSQKTFSRLRWDKQPFFPTHVADAGGKESIAFTAYGKSVRRRIAINYGWSAKRTYDRLIKPRTFDQAKKRLIELASHDQEKQERPLFLEFIRRHGSSQCLFGERVDWKGNIWETEFHLGFYQLIGEENNIRFPPHTDYPSRLRRLRKMPNISNIPDSREITLVATSLRFVGDLRDRLWTCHFFSSIARDDGFTSLANEVTDTEQSKEEFYSEIMGQRKLLEMTYVQKILFEMGESSNGILAAFQSELDVPETRDPQNESYEFVHNYSRLHLRAGEILRDILTQLDLALRAIEEWERREDTRPVRSRWSKKDEERYGQKLTTLSRKCRTSIQNLQMQRNRLEEQQKSAEQRHNNLISYMQLSEARTSSRSAEDVRLFTYVTIIFLPLSFSSSLFSMQGAPTGSTIYVMVPTTVIALVVTFFALSNMKVLDRNFNFWMYKATANARRKMEGSKHSWGFAWDKISQDLEKSAQLRLTKPEDEKHLPAESKWWYLLFGLSYILKVPRLFVLQGVRTWESRHHQHVGLVRFSVDVILALAFLPVCTFIFAVQFLTVTAGDVLKLMWKSARAMGKRTLDSRPSGRESSELSRNLTKDYLQETRRGKRNDQVSTFSDDGGDPSSDLAVTTKHFNNTFRTLFDWLQSPPRPIKDYTKKKVITPAVADVVEVEPRLRDPEPKNNIITASEEALSDEDEWEKAIEQDAVWGPKMTSRPDDLIENLRQVWVDAEESYQTRPSRWTKWKRKFGRQDSPVSKV